HASSPWYVKPKLPLPVFTVQHYAGPVTYQVHKFLNKNHDQLRPEVLDIFSQSHLKVQCGSLGKVASSQSRIGKIICSRWSDTQLLEQWMQLKGCFSVVLLLFLVLFFFWLIDPILFKLQVPDIFDTEYVACQLRHSGILEAICIRKEGYPVRIPFHHFLIRELHGQAGARTGIFQVPSPTLYQLHHTGSHTSTSLENHYPFPPKEACKVPHHSELILFFPTLSDNPLTQINQVTEVSPPEFKAKANLSLPPDINSFPFSTFMKSHFQLLRFIHDKELQDWQKMLLGNYIVRHGLASHSLRNELLSQVATQVWKNPDLQQSQQGWVLMAALLSTFAPSPYLGKPLLKFVSDHGLEGYNGICQRKLLMSMKLVDSDAEASRSFPPTQLEWIANQRKGKMVLDVYTYQEEKFSAEVESWTTGEQYAGWILSSRGLEAVPRGWSVSLFTGDVWQDLIGCDFVLDLIGGREASNWPSQSLPDYPITPEHDGGYVQQSSVERSVALLLAPCPLQPPFLPRIPRPREPDERCTQCWAYSFSLASLQDMQSEGSLTGRMKGGGKIGPTRQGAFPGASLHKAPSPSFSPSAMVVPQPQPMLPSVDPSQVAVQQQAFINQQALLMVRGKGFKTVMGNFQGSQDHPYSLKRPPAGCTCLLVAQKFDLIKGGHLSSGSAVLPSPPPPPGKLSSTIKEKQLPLMGLFSRPQTTLSSTSELPPPPPPPPPPVPPPMPPSFPSDSARTMVDDSNIKTQLFSISPSVTFSYANPTWKLFLRKEVFYPKELFSHPYCLNLLCDQIIRDTYSDSCIRLSKEERRKMKDLLGKQAVGMNVRSISEDGIKKRIVLAARDNWANYFSRLFPVKGENGSDIQLLGVSHRGLQLLKRITFGPLPLYDFMLSLDLCSYADVLSLELLGWNVLQLSLKDEQLILHSHKAWQIKAMVEQFLHELKQDSKYVIALRSYVTDDKSLLSFKKGNFIRVLPMEGLEPGWQFGSIGGRSGLFPSALVQFAAVPEHLSLHLNQQEEGRKSLTRGKEETVPGKEVRQTMIPQSLTGRRFRETCGERRLWGGSTGRGLLGCRKR
uniref:Myosin XVB n=1 Tax=Varanus komodoensis TaxID=61221 RepID=A0A8D2LHE6_VARKO